MESTFYQNCANLSNLREEVKTEICVAVGLKPHVVYFYFCMGPLARSSI